MSWEWSHTVEAYSYAQEQVQKQERSWLEVVFAEWEALDSREDFEDGFNEEKYNAALLHAKELPDDVLADFIWEKMEALATCTNGGWEAHCCPFGCGCHMVPFGPDKEDE